jgi:uncharacterized protein YmfQ (DUF2313 family)
MDMTTTDYLRQLQALLPQGAAWPRDADVVLTSLLCAEADELARIDARAQQLLMESDPRRTSELLDDWERNFGLPDICLTPATTVAERRKRLHQRVVAQGGQSAAYFISLLALLGYPGCTVSEYLPMKANSKCNASLNQGGWRYAFRVNVPLAANVKPLTVAGRCNEPLASWGDPGLLCLLAKEKPAHTNLYLSYGV